MGVKQAIPEKYKMKAEESYINGIYVAQPKKRDNIERPPVTVDFNLKVERPNIKKTRRRARRSRSLQYSPPGTLCHPRRVEI
jgi:hypothetical protein